MTPEDAAKFMGKLADWYVSEEPDSQLLAFAKEIAHFMGLEDPETLMDFGENFIADLSKNHARLQGRAP